MQQPYQPAHLRDSPVFVARELATYRVGFTVMSISLMMRNSQRLVQGAFFCRGRPVSEPQLAVGFAISNSIASKFKSIPKGISDHLMVLQLRLKHEQYVTIISTNADYEKEKFCSDLCKLIVSTSASDKLIIMGYFNTVIW